MFFQDPKSCRFQGPRLRSLREDGGLRLRPGLRPQRHPARRRRGEADAAGLPVQGRVVLPQQGLAKGVDPLEVLEKSLMFWETKRKFG